jgi:hypothetical protein
MTSQAYRYELRFEDRTGYLFAKVKAEKMNVETALSYLSKIAEMAGQTGHDQVMVVRDVPVMLSDGDLFSTTHFFLEKMSDTYVAFVNPHEDIGEDMEFAIRIGTNRGGLYGLFPSVNEAEKWLLETAEEPTLQVQLAEFAD